MLGDHGCGVELASSYYVDVHRATLAELLGQVEKRFFDFWIGLPIVEAAIRGYAHADAIGPEHASNCVERFKN